MINRFKLTDSFTLTGRRWLPSEPDRSLGGTLKCSPDEMSLEIQGALVNVPIQRLMTVGDDFDRLSVVHGHCNGVRVTLLNAYATGYNHNFVEPITTTYSASYVFLGRHINEPSFGAIGLSFRCSHLDDFVHRDPFERYRTPDDELTVRFPEHESIDYLLASEGTTLSLTLTGSRTETHMKVVVEGWHVFRFAAVQPQPLQWYIRRMYRLCFLLTLLTDENVRPLQITIEFPNEHEVADVFFRTSNRREKQKEAGLLLLYFGQVADSLESLVDKAISAQPTLVDSLELFIEGREHHGTSEGRFLVLTQSLEAFSRAISDAQYMPASDYEAVRSALVQAIPSCVGEDHRAGLKSRIKYGNEYAFRKRIELLIDSLMPSTVELVCQSKSAFVSGIVDTRNYLTHYTDELRAKALTGGDLFWACEKLALLLRLVLLKEFGIAEDLLRNRIAEHPNLMQYVRLAKKFREAH